MHVAARIGHLEHLCFGDRLRIQQHRVRLEPAEPFDLDALCLAKIRTSTRHDHAITALQHRNSICRLVHVRLGQHDF